MEKNNNTMDISSILGAMPIVKWVYAYFTKPKLEIYIDEKRTYDDLPVENANNRYGYFIHVMVKNSGYKNSIARNCNGWLLNVEQQDPDGKFYHHHNFRSPEILHWANKVNERGIDFGPIDIDTETPRRLDVGNTISGLNILHFFTQHKNIAHGNQTDFPPGDYRIKIYIKGDNVKSKPRCFLIHWGSGDYKDLTIKEG